MLFCKEPTCKSLAVVGGYCLSHQLERANELYEQLNQRNDSGSRMSREITERIANESQLKQRAEQYKSDAMRFETERDAAIDSAEYYKHTHLSMQTTIDELAAQLATAQADNVRMTTLAVEFETERDLVISKLATAQAERDAALVKIKVLLNVAHDAVGHVAAANYPERESLAHKWIDDCYESKP